MQIDPKECHPAMDYTEHQKTYKLFLKLTVYTIVGVVALMALMAHLRGLTPLDRPSVVTSRRRFTQFAFDFGPHGR